jgi:ABC-type transport system substrate-binding protein
MNRSLLRAVPVVLVIGGWIISGCVLPGPGKNPGGEPQPNQPAASPTAATPASLTTTQIPTPEPTAISPAPIQTELGVPFEPLVYSAPDCEYGGEFKSIEALDQHTIRFSLCRPDAAFLTKIAFPSFGIVPQERLEETSGGGKGSPLLVEPIGTGPYRFERWEAGAELSYLAFEGYWGEPKASIPRLVFHWALDDSERLLQLQTGTVQGIDNPNPIDLADVQSDANLIWIPRPPLSVAYLGMNNTYPPLDNQLIRQALALAIDRQTIVTELFPAGFKLASHFTPCAVPNGCAGEAWYDYDPQRAKELLAEAGYAEGFQTQISYRNLIRGYLPQPAQVAEAIQTQLKENLNISARLVPIDSPKFLESVDEGLLPGLFLLGWGADYPDVSNFLDTHFGRNATKLFGNPFEDIILPLDQGASQLDPLSRALPYEAANNAIRQHIPMIPLAHGGWVYPETLAVAFQKSIPGAYASPFGFERFADLGSSGDETFVWMQRLEPLSLYCADETDVDSLRACAQVIESLYRFQAGGAEVEPGLAESCAPDGDLTVWKCNLRQGVKFHDSSSLDANDVVMSFLVQWDAANPLHKGRVGEFAYFKALWGGFLNGN